MDPALSRKYLDPQTLIKIGRLDIIARLVVEGVVTGLHRSPYHGFSVEFAEHREYVPGDDIRHIDWKAYGRLDRYFVKQYEEETDLHATVLLDISESMRYGSGEATKLFTGSCIAASLAYMILNQQDSVGMVTFDDQVRTFIPTGSSPSHLKFILSELDKTEPREKTNLGDVLHQIADRITRKGLIIVITDAFDDPENVLLGLRHLRHRKHEVVFFHVLDEAEREFPFEQMTRFEGLEDLPDLLCDPRALRKAYQEEIEAFIETLKMGCRRDRIDYVPIDTSTPLDVALSRYLATRQELRLK